MMSARTNYNYPQKEEKAQPARAHFSIRALRNRRYRDCSGCAVDRHPAAVVYASYYGKPLDERRVGGRNVAGAVPVIFHHLGVASQAGASGADTLNVDRRA